ncbi:hypothetical protein [Micromonospora sp. M71_S20]|uniref:hypothetical protein n=1 Tax=Micromonospora sp. M71_S20 TaxID=592872 RepID=UPI000EB1F8D8|nr:hypothetical protein [Micromonospora sp. M71_S20]
MMLKWSGQGIDLGGRLLHAFDGRRAARAFRADQPAAPADHEERGEKDVDGKADVERTVGWCSPTTR